MVGLLDRAKDVIAGHALASTAAGVTAAGVAASVVIGGGTVVGVGQDDLRAAADPPRLGSADQQVEPETKAVPDRDRARDRTASARDRQQRQRRGPTAAGTAADGTGAVEEADDPTGPGDDTAPGTDPTVDTGTAPDDGTPVEPEPEPVQDVRLVVKTEPGKGSAMPVSVTVVGLSGDQVGEVSVTWDGPETVTSPSGTCTGRPNSGWSCAASAAATSFRFGAQSNDAGTVTFTITVPYGSDADPSNNSVTIALTGKA